MPSSIISNGESRYDDNGDKYIKRDGGYKKEGDSSGARYDGDSLNAATREPAEQKKEVQRVETLQPQENSTGTDRVETVQQKQDLYFKNVEDQLAFKRGESLPYDVYENPNNSSGWKNPTVSAKSTTYTNWYRANDVKRSYGKSGEVIISDVKTGEILGIYENGAVTENYGSILIDETRPYQQEGSIKYRNALGEDVTIKVEKSHDKYFRNVEDQKAYHSGESLPYDVGTNPNDNGGWNNNPNPNVKTSYISYKMEKKPYVLGNESLGMKTNPSTINEMYKNMNQGSESQKRDIPGEALKASFIEMGDIQEKRMNWYMKTGENQFKGVPYVGGWLSKWAGRTGGATVGTIVNAPYGMAQGVTAFVAIAREKKLKEAYSPKTLINFGKDTASGLWTMGKEDTPQLLGSVAGMWAMGKVAGKASGVKVSKNSVTVTKQPSIFSLSKNTKGTTVRWGAEGVSKEIVESFQKKGVKFEVKKVVGYEKNIDKILPQKNIKKVSYKLQNGNEGILLKASKNKIQRTHVKDSGNTKVIENYVVNKNKGTDYSFKKTILDNGELKSVNKGFKSNKIVSIDRARSGKITNTKTPNDIEVSSDFVNFVKNNRLLKGMPKQEQLNIYEAIRSKKGITASGKEFNSITKSYAKTLNEGKVKESAYIKFGRGTPEAPAAITSDVAQVNRLTASLGRSGGVKLVKGRTPAKRTPMSRTFKVDPKPNQNINRLAEKFGNNRGNAKPTGNRLISRNPPKNIPKNAVTDIVHVKSVPKIIGNLRNVKSSGASAIAKASVVPGLAFRIGSGSRQGQGQINSQKPKSNQKTQQKVINQNIVSNIGGNRQAQGIFQNQKQKPSPRTRVIPVTGIKIPDPKVPVPVPFGIGGFKGKGAGFSLTPTNRPKNNKKKGIFGAQKSEINLGQLFAFGLKKGGKRGKR